MTLSPDTTKCWWLVPATRQGREHVIYTQDALLCDNTFAKHMAQVLEYTVQADGTASVTLQMNKMNSAKFGADWPETAGQQFYLYKRYVDLGLVQKAVTELKRLDVELTSVSDGATGKKPLFIRLTEQPSAWDTEHLAEDDLQWRTLNADQQTEIASNRFALQQSQKEALQTSLSRHLQVVWGPPGDVMYF